MLRINTFIDKATRTGWKVFKCIRVGNIVQVNEYFIRWKEFMNMSNHVLPLAYRNSKIYLFIVWIPCYAFKISTRYLWNFFKRLSKYDLNYIRKYPIKALKIYFIYSDLFWNVHQMILEYTKMHVPVPRNSIFLTKKPFGNLHMDGQIVDIGDFFLWEIASKNH